MDWQTKDYLDERLNDIEDKIELIMDKLGISENKDEDLDALPVDDESKKLDF